MKYALLGYGNLGVQIENFLLKLNVKKSDIIYFDDSMYRNSIIRKNVFKFKDFEIAKHKNCNFVICLGYKHLEYKREIIRFLKSRKRKIPNIIHKTCYLDENLKIGDGNIIYPMTNIDYKVIIGDGNIINNSCVVSHESTIKSCCFFSPSVTLCGFTKVDDCCFIGSNSVISNNVRIGKNSIVGLGTSLTKSIPANSRVIGSPFKNVNNILLK